MADRNEHAVDVLNGLIKTTLDSANGYKDAAENAEQSQYKGMFADRAVKREQLARELQEEVRALGGKAKTEQGALGKMHNKFVDLKHALGGDDKSVIDEVERGEDYIRDKFQEALKEDLPQPVRAKVERCYQSVKADHDEVSRIKHTLH